MYIIYQFRDEIFGLAKDWTSLNTCRSWTYLEKVKSSTFGQIGQYQVFYLNVQLFKYLKC